jgi:hypothetical protein
VQDDILRSELEQVQSELAAAEVEYASLGAKIKGLQARSEALTQALSGIAGHSGKAGITKPRTEAIVEVLKASDTEMTINDVIAALRDSGRDHESYENIASDLAYLAEQRRIDRPRRGVYARPEHIVITLPQGSRIVITLTQGSLNSNYVNLGRHLDFFPADAVGSASRRGGEGTVLTLHYDGLLDPVETDIDAHHKFFRDRTSTGKFFAHHGLKAGEKIAIEKQSDYEYRVLPVG